MNDKEFMEIFHNRVNQIVNTVKSKSDEYAAINNDRFVNFKEHCRLRKKRSPIESLDDIAAKHWAAYNEEMEKMNNDPLYVPTKSWITDKIGDMIIYLILQEGQIEERRRSLSGEPTNPTPRY